ncbi:MAG: DegT/DnrJ/EryC1/StrS family aminotransferase [Armatimonadota bacterium]|nr:DegT/DnrJ/EryC1/StrS family aminotransferase [Armatimonadota bacterium]
MPSVEIPLVDLQTQYQHIREEVLEAFDEALTGMQLVLGPNVQAFEREWAEFCDVEHAVGVGSGTEALHLLLRAAGVGPGDEVITVSFTFIGTIEAILHVDATPVLVDIDPETFCIDPEQVARRITPNTRAVIPVHLYGHPADMDGLREAVGDRDVMLLEDAAQAHGAQYRGRRVGGIGRGAIFSFYLSKNLAAYGEAGAVTTDGADLEDRVRYLRVHGSREKYVHRYVGYNSRMDELQAAVLRIKLRRLADWNEARRRHATRYNQNLADLDVQLPVERPWARHVYHVYTIRTPRRDELAAALKEAGIGHAIHYRVPSHLQEAMAHLGYGPGSLPETERAADQVLSLPMYPELTNEQIDRVCEVVHGVLG